MPAFPAALLRGANPAPLVEEQVDKSLSEVGKDVVHSFLLGGDFCGTFDENKQEDLSANGNCLPSYFGNGAFPSAAGVQPWKRGAGCSPRPCHSPRPAGPRPPAGHAQRARPGRQVCVAARSCRRWLSLSPPSLYPVAGSREVTCRTRLKRSHRTGCGEARGPRCCRGASGPGRRGPAARARKADRVAAVGGRRRPGAP